MGLACEMIEKVTFNLNRSLLWGSGEAQFFVAICERHIKPGDNSMDVVVPGGYQLEGSLQVTEHILRKVQEIIYDRRGLTERSIQVTLLRVLGAPPDSQFLSGTILKDKDISLRKEYSSAYFTRLFLCMIPWRV